MTDDFDSFISDITEISDKNESNVLKKGKNSRSEVIAYGYHFDSKEELDFFEWILEAKEYGFISEFEYQPESFTLFEGKTNEKGKYVMRPHVYTADFKIVFSEKWIEFRKSNKLKVFDKFDEKTVFVDIKGAWSIYDDGRSFQINQKWLMDKHGIYVWKIVPFKFFEKAWLPKKCVLTRKTKKISKKYEKLLTFEHSNFVLQP